MAFWGSKQNKPIYHEPSMDDFLTKNWNKLSENERLDALQYLENQIAVEEGRKPRQVFPDDRLGKGECGYYEESDSTHIYINRDYLQSSKNGGQYDAMNTVIHEGRHAYQDDCVQGRITHNESPETIDKWKKNSDEDVYYPSGLNRREYLNYRYQPIEEDANNFAQSKIEGFSDRFGSDRNYSKYIEKENKIRIRQERDATRDIGTNYKQIISDDIDRRYEAKHPTGEIHRNSSDGNNVKSYQINYDSNRDIALQADLGLQSINSIDNNSVIITSNYNGMV